MQIYSKLINKIWLKYEISKPMQIFCASNDYYLSKCYKNYFYDFKITELQILVLRMWMIINFNYFPIKIFKNLK